MRTLVITGVGGFVGLRLAGRARATGVRVRGIDRSVAAVRRAERAGCTVFHGDVRDAALVRHLCRGADAVVHTAAMVEEDGDWSDMRAVNVTGARVVAEAAADAGVRRFIHLSSAMVYGFRYPAFVTEDGPLRGEGNPHCQTRIESERVVLGTRGLSAVVLRPGDVYGPGSMPWVVRPLSLMRRRLLVLPGGGQGTMNHLYVDNLIDGILLAIRKGTPGRAYNLTDGGRTTFADYFARLALVAGCPLPRPLPRAPLRLALRTIERGGELFGRSVPIRAAALDFISRPHPYSIARAEQELGFVPRVALPQGMARTERWLRAEGLIRRSLPGPDQARDAISAQLSRLGRGALRARGWLG